MSDFNERPGGWVPLEGSGAWVPAGTSDAGDGGPAWRPPATAGWGPGAQASPPPPPPPPPTSPPGWRPRRMVGAWWRPADARAHADIGAEAPARPARRGDRRAGGHRGRRWSRHRTRGPGCRGPSSMPTLRAAPTGPATRAAPVRPTPVRATPARVAPAPVTPVRAVPSSARTRSGRAGRPARVAPASSPFGSGGAGSARQRQQQQRQQHSQWQPLRHRGHRRQGGSRPGRHQLNVQLPAGRRVRDRHRAHVQWPDPHQQPCHQWGHQNHRDRRR